MCGGSAEWPNLNYDSKQGRKSGEERPASSGAFVTGAMSD